MNKQIEEMAKDLCDCMPTIACDFYDDCKNCPRVEMAEYLYNAGYRKSTDVAMEVAEQFKEIAKQYLLEKGLYLAVFKNALSHAETELKKKYESEGAE